MAEFLAPGALEDPELYAGACSVELDEGGGLRRWIACRQIPAPDLLRAHVLRSALGDSEETHDGAPVRAVGFRYPSEVVLGWFSLDLDGGTDAREVVRALRSLGLQFMITNGSGTPGRFRVLARCHPLSCGEIERAAAALVRSLGFEVRPGAIEVFPSPRRNGRAPFGDGGCAAYSDDLARSETLHPFEALERLRALWAVDLGRYLTSTDRRPQIETVGHVRRKGRGSTAGMDVADFLRHRAEGARPGERETGIVQGVAWCWSQGWTVDRATRYLQNNARAFWGACRGMSTPRRVGQTMAAIARCARSLFARYCRGRPSARLTEADALNVARAVDSLGLGETERAAAFQYLVTLGPLLKGGQQAGLPISIGFRERERAATGTGARYLEIESWIRPLLTTDHRYRPAALCFNRPALAHFKRWSTPIRFEKHAPPRSLARGVDAGRRIWARLVRGGNGFSGIGGGNWSAIGSAERSLFARLSPRNNSVIRGTRRADDRPVGVGATLGATLANNERSADPIALQFPPPIPEKPFPPDLLRGKKHKKMMRALWEFLPILAAWRNEER